MFTWRFTLISENLPSAKTVNNFYLLAFPVNDILAAAWQNQQNDLCAQRRLRSAWASAQSLTTCWAHSEDWLDWADAQADLSLPWAHRSFCWFWCAASYLLYNIIFSASDKVALLIGNSDYRCEELLIAPPYDVQRLTESFRNLEFKVVSLLNLSKTEIETAVLHFCKLIDRNVYVVFYFCGHGFEEDGCYFLVPTDAVHGYGINECVCVESILENFQKKSPPLILMMIDICRKL